MSRWIIEKDGTGIEKSGTGIEKSGTGIEKSGTGIEKAGTGIEKAGTGIRRGLLALALAAITCAGNIQAGTVDPAGSLQIVVNNNTVAVSWIIGDSVFSGVSTLDGSYANLMLTEVALIAPTFGDEVTGGGTGAEVTGGGTGAKVTGGGTGAEVTGGGTGAKVTGGGTGAEVTGGGTGAKVTGGGTGAEVTGGGTGAEVTGGGTGAKVTGGGTGAKVTGGGTGAKVTDGATGSTILVTGGGTGSEGITVTLPNGTGMSMEVSVDCGTAGVSILDENSVPIISFSNVAVVGNTGFCGADGFGAGFIADPGFDFRSN
jgi:hypothetical protein